MPTFAISPGVYSQEQDLSTGVQATATTIASAVFASPKGSLTPFFSSSTTAFLNQFGKPNLTFGYGHHSCLAFLMEGSNLWSSRVVDGALWGTSTVIGDFEGINATTQYVLPITAGSLTDYTHAEQDVYDIVFNSAVLTGMTLTATYTIVGSDAAGNVVNLNGTATVAYVTSNNATLTAFATALNTSINTLVTGSGYVGVVPTVYMPSYLVDDGSTHSNYRTIQMLSTQNVAVNVNTAVTWTTTPTNGVVLPTTTYQNAKMFDVFGVDPGAWNNTIAYTISNVDLGTPQRGQIQFSGPVLTGNTVTVTYLNTTTGVTVTSSTITYATSSNYTLNAVAAALTASPFNLSATVVNVLGSTSSNRTIQVIAPNAYANMSITVTVAVGTGSSAPTAVYSKTLNAIAPTNTFTLKVFTSDDIVNPKETFVVSMAQQLDGFGGAQNIADVINLGPKKSKYIRIYQPTSSLVAQFTNVSQSLTFLTGGFDGATVTSTDLINGWTMYDSREKVEMRMMIGCGYTLTGLQQYIDSIAQARKDCIAIIDVPSNMQDPASAVAYRNNILNINSSYSAIYTPDLQIQDQYTNRVLFIPPSGYVAAVYARTDRVAATWFAPAGLNRADLSSVIIGLRYNYNKGDRDLMYPAQINYVQMIPGKGYPINSASTLQSKASALSNVNVRRLLIFMEVSIVDALVYYQWEPDDDFTRSQVVAVVTNFAKPIKNARGLKDFLVVSDTTNNSPSDEDEGVLNVQFLIKPIIPAKFIRLITTITSSGANFAELVATA